jgi:hypothetical protein
MTSCAGAVAAIYALMLWMTVVSAPQCRVNLAR